ncbi:type VII secretion protein EccCa [Mycolicibacterium vaccae]|uniref:type VII secretion protein EccCa n=1 Tax=Mycolicibacterium vaccae TaxID=1810 RepID=UPI003CF78D0D
MDTSVAAARLVLDAPPDVPEATPLSPMVKLMPVVMLVGMLGMGAWYLSMGGPRQPMSLFFPAMMVFSVLGSLVYGARAGARGQLDHQRGEYLRYLAGVERTLMAAAGEQHRRLHARHPEPTALWTGGVPVRAEQDDGFCCVRVGVGAQPAAFEVVAPMMPDDDTADPVTVGAARRLVRAYSALEDVPVTVDLRAVRRIDVTGDLPACRALARAVVCQVAAHHHPDHVEIGVHAGRDEMPGWDWIKWLPGAPSTRHRVVVVDGSEPPPAEQHTTHIVLTPGPPHAPVSVRTDGRPVAVTPDAMTAVDAETCARHLWRTAAQPAAAPPGEWLSLHGIRCPDTIDAAAHRVGRAVEDHLRVPVGTGEDGTVVALDIKEAAAGGMGPHGLCVGATGSGKSEFLRTLTLGMIAAHPPDELNLVLVDFKGGATFLGFEAARHVAAVITNLADEAHLVARMRDALAGEVTRRQELLRAAGNLTDLAAYRQARRAGRDLAPLPALFIVVDEFSELLSQHPDFAELFVAIGRLGRSLGMHLLLASQRLDEGRLRGLETHLSYRVCLKTFSASDSRAVLGVPDAHHLPAAPGAAYLRTADGALTRFQTAYVSGGYTPDPSIDAGSTRTAVEVFTRATAPRPEPSPPRKPLLENVLQRFATSGAPAHPVWLPPLRRPPRLDRLLDSAGPLRVPIGVVDCPFEQRYEPLMVDVSGAAGNLAVIGGPQSGKSTTLRTVITAFAATHDATQIQFYCLDFGGGALSRLRGMPHVGSVAGRGDTELCRRTVATVDGVLRSRESAFRRLGVSTTAEYRTATADRFGEVFLVVDGWAALRDADDHLEAAITALAGRGLSYGVHIMLASSRWADLRPALKDQLGTRIELRLGDPAESEMDRRRARELTDLPAGHGITRSGREFVIATCDDVAVHRQPDTPPAPPVELLPHRVALAALAGHAGPGAVVVGVGEDDLRPVQLDLGTHPHLLILGDGECGKTALLRTLCTQLIRNHTPGQAQLEIVDYRRTLLGVVESDHLGGYSVSGVALCARMEALQRRLTARLPDEHVTQQQLRSRSWWTGPDVYLVIDDYDLVAGATGNPLTPLADFLPHAKDVGLHVIVARRSGGAARAMFDPVLARLRDMGCSGLTMSASPDEGVLLGGVRPGPLPPGRGVLTVRGRRNELVQVAWADPP